MKNVISKFLHVLYPLLVLLIALVAWMIKGDGVPFSIFLPPSANPVLIPEVQYCYGSCLGMPDAPLLPDAAKHTSVRHSISFSASI